MIIITNPYDIYFAIDLSILHRWGPLIESYIEQCICFATRYAEGVAHARLHLQAFFTTPSPVRSGHHHAPVKPWPC